MTSRAGVVVTGTEVLTGRVSDRNGPWLAEQLRLAGVDIAQIVVVGDRPADLLSALEFLAGQGCGLIITSGGLGPTADDLTADVVADFQRRAMRVDDDLEARIAAIVERLSRGRGWRLDPQSTAAATRKQARVPDGATVLEPVGTAPGLVVPPPDGTHGPTVLVLPGPPRELQGMWPAAIDAPPVRAAIGDPVELLQATIRLWGTPESELAASLGRFEGRDAGLEITTCLRDGELEIVTRYAPERQGAYEQLTALLVEDFPDTVFSADGRTVDDIVADALLDAGLTISTAESCTGGLLGGRLTERPGSSAYVTGGLITYANEVKQGLAYVPEEMIDDYGAVSAEVARAMADGVRRRLGTDIGVGITGVAGPGGGTRDKPVGLVHLCASSTIERVERRITVPGDRRDVRHRSVTVAMHMLRELLGD